MNLKKGTQVKILSGKDRGKTGEILEINPKLEKVKVKSINMIKRHTKPTKENKGGIISKESFIHQSNIKNIDIKTDAGLFKNQELSVLYHEEKMGESVFFKPVCHRFSQQLELLAHRVLNADQILKVSMIEFEEGKTIDIF